MHLSLCAVALQQQNRSHADTISYQAFFQQKQVHLPLHRMAWQPVEQSFVGDLLKCCQQMKPGLNMQVNKIRQSLQLVARNSTAFGLHQPHMERTKLCELGDEQLDPQYIEQRARLRDLVQQLAKPKRVNGKVMTGPGLAELVSQMVTALNARDIPTAGSILEHFNKELVYR